MIDDAEKALESLKEEEIWAVVVQVGDIFKEHSHQLPKAISAVLYAFVRLEFKGTLLDNKMAHVILDDILAVRDAYVRAHDIQGTHEWKNGRCQGCGKVKL